MLTLTHVLVVLGLLAVAVVVDLVSPTRKCARCRGERVSKSRWDARIIGCPRCKGTGRCARLGARIVSAVFWSLRAAISNAREEKP